MPVPERIIHACSCASNAVLILVKRGYWQTLVIIVVFTWRAVNDVVFIKRASAFYFYLCTGSSFFSQLPCNEIGILLPFTFVPAETSFG